MRLWILKAKIYHRQCGKGPFARVSDIDVSDDQTVPSSIASKLAKRDGAPAQVMAIGLDTNFSSSV